MRITRRSRLAVACGVAAVMALGGFAASVGSIAGAHAAEVEGPKVKWLLSTWGKRRGITEGIESLAKHVSDATDGNFEISIQYGGVLSKPAENLDGLKIGAFEAAMFCPVYHPGKTPALTGLDLAFMPIFDMEARAKVHEAYFQHPVVQQEFANWNARPLISALMPGYEVMGKGEPPREMKDWEGLRLHAAGGMGDVLRSLGAVTTTLPAPETYQSLERGVIDGLAFPFTYAFAAYRLHEISDWYTADLALGSTTCPVAVSQQAWDALPQQYKDLIERVKPTAYKEQREKNVEIDAKNLAAFKEAGLTPVSYPAEVRQQIIDRVAKQSWENWAKARSEQGLPGQELLDFILAEAKSAQGS